MLMLTQKVKILEPEELSLAVVKKTKGFKLLWFFVFEATPTTYFLPFSFRISQLQSNLYCRIISLLIQAVASRELAVKHK